MPAGPFMHGGAGSGGGYSPFPWGDVAGAATGLFGTFMQGRSQSQARRSQERARQEALAYEQEKEARAERARRSRWDVYQKAYRLWYERFGDAGINRYGVPVGVDYRSGAPGAPAPQPGADAPITLAGGRQIPKSEYDAYVASREARRAGGAPSEAAAPGATIGQMIRPVPDVMRPRPQIPVPPGAPVSRLKGRALRDFMSWR